MRFNAVHGCARCQLRFERCDRCPACGSREIDALQRRQERARFRRGALPRRSQLLLPLAAWCPERRGLILVGVGVAALLAPATIGYALFGETAFQSLWISTEDLTTYWDSLSPSGFGALAAFGGGILLALLTALSVYAKWTLRPASHATVQVFTSATEPARTEFRGRARRATVEIESLVQREPCLVFGVHGEIAGATLDDADGGDFDLELDSGERVMVSLEHAVLQGDGASGEVTRDDAWGAFLDARAIPVRDDEIVLHEVIVRDGDEIVVSAEVSGHAIADAPFRAKASRARVLAGQIDAPVLIRLASAESPAETDA